jgi:hypothetical protein
MITQGHQPHQEQSILCPSRRRGASDSAGLLAKAQLSHCNLFDNFLHTSVRDRVTITWICCALLYSSRVYTAKSAANQASAEVRLHKRTSANRSIGAMSLALTCRPRARAVFGWPAAHESGHVGRFATSSCRVWAVHGSPSRQKPNDVDMDVAAKRKFFCVGHVS